MKRIIGIVTLVLMVAFIGLAYAQSQGYIVFRQGAKELTVKSGGTIAVESGGIFNVESGGYLKVAGTAVTGSAAELNYLDGTTLGTSVASKILGLGTTRNTNYLSIGDTLHLNTGLLDVISGSTVGVKSGGLVDIESGGEIDINAGGTLDINGGFTTPVAITSAYDSLTVAESGRTIIGRPLAAMTNFVLPPAAADLQFTFFIADADSGRLVAATGDSIIAADGSASKVSGTVAGSVTVKAADGVRWFMINPVGTWTASAN